MAYSGYLLALKSGGTYTALPITYFKYDTYKITPCQMLDLDSTRDTTGVLHRNVLDHTATKIEIETVPMDSASFSNLYTLIKNNFISSKAHDVTLNYYDPFSNTYKEGHFYIPDIQFKIRNIDNTNYVVNYDSNTLTFIEY